MDTDKGDEQRPDVRCRLVIQETRSSSTIAKGATFAATPPLECLRIVCSLVMSTPTDKDHVIRFLDISRAHPHCRIRRLVYIRLPEEDPRSVDKDLCGRLNMALYGTRDAGQNFEFEVMEVELSVRIPLRAALDLLLPPWRRLCHWRLSRRIAVACQGA